MTTTTCGDRSRTFMPAVSKTITRTLGPVALEEPISFDDLLAKMGAKDRTNIERHLAACEQEPDPAHARNWRRLAQRLGTLASFAVQTVGQHSVMFFVQDGKYRMQGFALEDQRNGQIQVYL